MDRRTFLQRTIPAMTLFAGCTSNLEDANKSTTTTTERITTTTPTGTPDNTTANSATTNSATTNSATTNSATTNSATTNSATTTQPTTTNLENTTQPTTSAPETSVTETETSSTSSETTKTTIVQTTTNKPRDVPSHPSVKGLFDEPTKGPTPFTAKATIITFEDPSCPNCATFEQKTYPKLERNHINSGELTFVYRSLPVVHKWGIPASYALEAAYVRDEKTFWALRSYYFANQDQFNTENILPKTKQYINANTKLSGSAIITDAQNRTHKSNIREDMLVGKRANIRGTPAFHLFRSGKHLTKVLGNQSYRVFKNALGL